MNVGLVEVDGFETVVEPGAESAAERAVVDVVVAESSRLILAARTRWKVDSSLLIWVSKSVRYRVNLAWLKTSGCFITTRPSSRSSSPTQSIHLQSSATVTGFDESTGRNGLCFAIRLSWPEINWARTGTPRAAVIAATPSRKRRRVKDIRIPLRPRTRSLGPSSDPS